MELPKLPRQTDNSALWYWMEFIRAEKEEELAMLERINPQMSKAVGVLKELSADERTRMLYEEREKARRDIASLMGGARQEGLQEGLQKGRKEGKKEGKKEGVNLTARNAIEMGMDIDSIIKLTGLSREEIENL